jgi:hypothetical protein
VTEAELKPGYEEVFRVVDYYDGPRKGVANFRGKPHFYDCIFDEARDEYSDLYHLTPLSQYIFKLAKEDWDILGKMGGCLPFRKSTRRIPSGSPARQGTS